MSRLLVVLAAASATGVIAIALTIDPEQPLAVAAMVLAAAVLIGAVAGLVLLAGASDARGRRRSGTATAMRRALEAGAIAGLLLVLRVIDGLTLITGGFVIGAFLAAELILSTRPDRASR